MTDLRLAPYAAATLSALPRCDVSRSQRRVEAIDIRSSGTAHFFVSVGLPAWLGYLTFAAEAAGGVLLVLGVQSRWVALSLVLPLVGANRLGACRERLGLHRTQRWLGVSGISGDPLRRAGDAR